MAEILTTVRFPSDLHEALRLRAFRERRAIADLVREAVRDLLARSPAASTPTSIEDDPFWKVAGSIPGGQRDDSVEHDHYLYGTPKRRRTSRRSP